MMARRWSVLLCIVIVASAAATADSAAADQVNTDGVHMTREWLLRVIQQRKQELQEAEAAKAAAAELREPRDDDGDENRSDVLGEPRNNDGAVLSNEGPLKGGGQRHRRRNRPRKAAVSMAAELKAEEDAEAVEKVGGGSAPRDALNERVEKKRALYYYCRRQRRMANKKLDRRLCGGWYFDDWDPHSHGPHSHGPHSHGPHSHGPHSHGVRLVTEALA